MAATSCYSRIDETWDISICHGAGVDLSQCLKINRPLSTEIQWTPFLPQHWL